MLWPTCLAPLVTHIYGHHSDSPYFDRQMLIPESSVANRRRQQHAFEKCSECVYNVVAAWPDLPRPVSRQRIDTLVQTVGGSMRYAHTLDRDTPAADAFVEDLTVMVRVLLRGADR